MHGSNIGSRLFITGLLYFSKHIRGQAEVDVSRIYLNKNGDIVYDSQLPRCDNGTRIKLLQYKYLQCPPGKPCSPDSQERLTPEAEAILHQMCSLKHACLKAAFPASDFRTMDIPLIEVTYKCLAQPKRFTDICANKTVQVNRSIHFVYGANALATSLDTCICLLNSRNSTFNLTLEDVRLKDSRSNNCSPAELRIGYQRYSCDAASGGYGSVFRKSIGENLTHAIISLTSRPTHAKPEMVYLTVKPKDKVLVTCGSGMSGEGNSLGMLQTTTVQRSLEEHNTTFNLTTKLQKPELLPSTQLITRHTTEHGSDNNELIYDLQREKSTHGPKNEGAISTIMVVSCTLLTIFVNMTVGFLLYHRLKPFTTKGATTETNGTLERIIQARENRLDTISLQRYTATASNTARSPSMMSVFYDEPKLESNETPMAEDNNVPEIHYAVSDTAVLLGGAHSTPAPSNNQASVPAMPPGTYQELNQVLRSQLNNYASLKRGKLRSNHV